MPTIDLAQVGEELRGAGITHVVWVPDSELGGLEDHLHESIRLVRACREGEAMAIAAGLMLGGARPVVVCQCTGFFEAGDAFRNVAKDLGLPLFVLIGHRNRVACAAGKRRDSAAQYLEPVLAAWELTYDVLEPNGDPEVISRMYAQVRRTGDAAAVIIAE